MSRPADGLAHVAASLARLTAAERPEWVSARSWGAARALLASLRSDVVEALGDGPTLTAEALGVSRSTLDRWMRDGWLAPERERLCETTRASPAVRPAAPRWWL